MPALSRDWVEAQNRRVAGQAGYLAARIKDSQLERGDQPAFPRSPETQKPDSVRYLVRVTSFRRRLLDEDNLCEKFHVDAIRYAGIISGDEATKARIVPCQVKVRTEAEEGTLIEIFPL